MNAALKKVLITAAIEVGIELARVIGVKIVAMATDAQTTRKTMTTNEVN